MSAFIDAEKFGIWAPVGQLESLKDGGSILVNYLRIVGTLLKDGHFKQAKLRALQAKQYAEQQAISETRP